MNAPIAAVRELTYAQAIQEALALAMDADPRVFLMGEDIGLYGGAFQVTGDLVGRYGEDRVIDTPISELGGAGLAASLGLMTFLAGTIGAQPIERSGRDTWTMPPLNCLAPAKLTLQIRGWMGILRLYLLAAGGMVVARIVSLAMSGQG